MAANKKKQQKKKQAKAKQRFKLEPKKLISKSSNGGGEGSGAVRGSGTPEM